MDQDSHRSTDVAVRGLSLRRGEIAILDRLEFTIPAGGSLGLVGPSGAGKTTCLEIVAGLTEADAGTVAIGGAEAAADRLAACAYMPQRDLLLPWLCALDNAALALRNRGARRGQARAAAAPLFERFGLGEFEYRRPDELSQGMRQRVAFLRTLLAGKPVLLLDEPFGALDAITRSDLQGWLSSTLREERRTTILVTHDIEEALFLCDRVAILTPRPARVAKTLDSPRHGERTRREVVTSLSFAAIRDNAMAVLEGSGR